MARLKSRHHFPPHGWKFYQPQTRWELPGNLSFNGAVDAIIQHRKQFAPFLRAYNLPTDMNAVGNELDSYNAIRCINAGYHEFVGDFGNESSLSHPSDVLVADVVAPSKHKNHRLISVVLPFCNKDAILMFKQVEWMGELGGAKDHDAILAFDHSTSGVYAGRVADVARLAFRSVSIFKYPNPSSTFVTKAAKEAFNLVADFMESTIQTPWIWWEADMTALKTGFMTTLQNAYERSRKPFFGPVVPQMGHMNGTSVYPPNTYSLCPSLRTINNDAFDTGMRGEMFGKMADASQIIYHVWVIRDGRFYPHGDGSTPANVTAEMLTQIPGQAVAFHRCKDDSIIRLLRSRK